MSSLSSTNMSFFLSRVIVGGIPHVSRGFNRVCPIYGTRLWYPIVLAVYGGFRRISLAQLIWSSLPEHRPRRAFLRSRDLPVVRAK